MGLVVGAIIVCQILFADEPTASLDKDSGREVVEHMQRLAREQLLNRTDGQSFAVEDRNKIESVLTDLALVLESWAGVNDCFEPYNCYNLKEVGNLF